MIQNNYGGRLQHSLGTGFNNKSVTADVIKGIHLTGKTVIVTGGNTGIGLETAKTLAAAGATVIVAARDLEKAAKNLKGINNVSIEQLDVMSPSSIEVFAANFLSTGSPLHILINNAGIMWVPLRRDERGIESQLATNYIGQFHLTARLWPALQQANGARVINVSSLGHHMSAFHFDDPNFRQREYETLSAYGQSKTASNLFAVELDRRGAKHRVRAYSVHPGSIAGTELGREASVELFQKMGLLDKDGNILPEIAATLKTIPQGAATTVWAATSPQLNTIGGVYCEDGDIADLLPSGPEALLSPLLHKSGVQPYSLDGEAAQRLWPLTEEMTGVEFTIE